jgi:hypothetical protein
MLEFLKWANEMHSSSPSDYEPIKNKTKEHGRWEKNVSFIFREAKIRGCKLCLLLLGSPSPPHPLEILS